MLLVGEGVSVGYQTGGGVLDFVGVGSGVKVSRTSDG